MAQRWAADRLDRDGYHAPGLDIPVLYGDLDTNRHVNNVMLGRFFEQSRVDAHFSVELPQLLHQKGLHALVARVAIDYLREVHYGAPLHVRLRVGHIGRTSAVEEQAAWQGDNCVALAEVVIACREQAVGAPWPDEARRRLEQLQR